VQLRSTARCRSHASAAVQIGRRTGGAEKDAY
jgi:hypothetical protein